MKTDNKESFIKKANLIPKILCLLAAFVIWIYVMEVDSPDHEEVFEDVPITISGSSHLDGQNLSVISGADILVDVTVKGQKSVIDKHSYNDMEISADVSKINEPGNYNLHLNFDLPSGLTLAESSVSDVNLYVDKKVAATINIRAALSSYQLPTGYELGEIKCEADTVTISGAETVVKDVAYAAIDVNLSNKILKESFTTTGNVLLYDDSDTVINSKYIKIAPTTMQVTVPVFTTKEVYLAVDTKYGYFNKDNSAISIEPKTILVKGEPSTLESMTEVVIAVVDEKTVKDSSKMTVDITPPAGITVVPGQSKTADVRVELKGMSKKTVTVSNISVNNPDGIKYELETESLPIDIIGATNTIKSISADNIVLKVDLKKFDKSSTVGTINPTVEVEFSKVNGLAYELGTYTVQMKVSK